MAETFRKNKINVFEELISMPGVLHNSLDILVATLAINLLSLALPITLMQTYDRILPYRALNSLVWLSIGCMTAMIFEFGFRTARSLISNWMAARFEHFMGCKAINKLLSSQLKDFDQAEIGDHLDRLNSIYTLKAFYAGQFIQTILEFPFAFLFLFAVYFLGGHLVLIPLTIAISLYFLIFITKYRYQSVRNDQLATGAKRSSYVLELLNGIHSIKTSAMEEQMMRRYERLQSSTANIGLAAAIWSFFPANLGLFLSQLTTFSVIIIGALDVIAGNLTLGVLTACSLFSTRALQPLISAAGFWFRWSDATNAKTRLDDLAGLGFENSEKAPSLPRDFSGSISFKELQLCSLNQSLLIQEDISFTINSREMVAIDSDDANCATSFLHLIMGKAKPLKGKVFVDDFDISEMDMSDLRGKIEYVSRSGTIFRGTVLENITMFDPYRKPNAMESANLLQLDEQVAKLPHGYETVLGSNASSLLSTSFVQRICLARALVFKPKILLLDRVYASLDYASSIVFHQLLLRLKGKCTIINVTGQPNLLGIADKVFAIRDRTLIRLDDLAGLIETN